MMLTKKYRLVLALTLILLGLAAPLLFKSEYTRHVLIMILLYMALGTSWNFIGGYGGQLSFAHATFFGFGAYSSSLLLIKLDVPSYIGFFVAGLISGVLALALGFPCFTAKLKGHYFALATVGFAEVVRLGFSRWKLVGMAHGISLPPTPSFKKFVFLSKIPYYYAIFALVLIIFVLIYKILDSKMGLYLRAIRENEEKVRHLGINIRAYKLFALFISAFFVGISGAFYAHYILYIEPNVMTLYHSLKIAMVAIVGGVGTFLGPVIGGFVIIGIDEGLRVSLGGSGKGVDLILFGVMLVLLAIYEPKGIAGILSKIVKKK